MDWKLHGFCDDLGLHAKLEKDKVHILLVQYKKLQRTLEYKENLVGRAKEYKYLGIEYTRKLIKEAYTKIRVS